MTVLSCDNLPGNGRAARTAVASFAALRDERLAGWIEQHVAFPSSVVDRITPATADADRLRLAHRLGVLDRWPVVTEPYRQWIVEDRFAAGRPPLEEAGVRFVGDVTPFGLAKTRLLNGSHCALGHLGYLVGHRTTDAAMRDPRMREYVERLMDEVAPLLPPAPGLDLPAYRRSLLARFANPALTDPLSRLCGRGSTKVPAYLLPSLVEAVERGRPHRMLALGVAAWLRYLRGHDFEGRPIEITDAHRERLTQAARAGGTDPRPLLAERRVFGDAGGDARLVRALEQALEHLDRHGAAEALDPGAASAGLGMAA